MSDDELLGIVICGVFGFAVVWFALARRGRKDRVSNEQAVEGESSSNAERPHSHEVLRVPSRNSETLGSAEPAKSDLVAAPQFELEQNGSLVSDACLIRLCEMAPVPQRLDRRRRAPDRVSPARC